MLNLIFDTSEHDQTEGVCTLVFILKVHIQYFALFTTNQQIFLIYNLILPQIMWVAFTKAWELTISKERNKQLYVV